MQTKPRFNRNSRWGNRAKLLPGKRRLSFEVLEMRHLLATLLVSSTSDSGPGSLRQAIIDSNSSVAVLDTIEFNIAGTGVRTISPSSALPIIVDAVFIDGYSQPSASANTNSVDKGLNTIFGIELAGNSAGGGVHGLLLGAGSNGSTVRGLVINRFSGDGIRVESSGNMLAGNFIGTNPLGTVASANGTGIRILGPSNYVGGPTPQERNLLSGNTTGAGVFFEGTASTGNVVRGNLIGTNSAGTSAVANNSAVAIIGAPGNIIGGTDSGDGNVLSGNREDGVVTFGEAATGNWVQGNFIGTNVSGTAAVPNARHGIYLLTSSNTIGGTTVGARNVISGNTQSGVHIENASFNTIQSNFIGVNAAGQAALANLREGVSVFGGVNNALGGTVAGAGNVISGNGQSGIVIFANGVQNTVAQGNWIGTNADGASLGNGFYGVFVANSSGNMIGGSPGGNTIAFNGRDGIAITGQFAGQAVGNQFQANSIYSNVGLGIDLGDDGADYPQDARFGPGLNNRQDFPILTEVIATAGGTTVRGALLGPNGATKHRIDFFANAAADTSGFGEGQTFLGSIIVNGISDVAVTFTATLPALPAGQPLVTSTATDITDRGSGPLNNTSEFSPPFLPPTVYTVTTTNDSGPGSLRAAITAANAHAGFDRIEFAMVATDAGHFYYQDDGVAGQVTLAKVAATTAIDDAGLPTTGTTAVDPDWPHAWFSIRPTAALPHIGEPVLIDGYTQAGASANTNTAPQGLNTVLRIEVSGQNSGALPGFAPGIFRFAQGAAASTIRGLVINRVAGPKISLVNATGVRVEGNFVGPDVSGTLAFAGTESNGVVTQLSTFDTKVGGLTAGARNLISANLNGVTIGRNTASVHGNLIGTDRTGTKALGNSDSGVSTAEGSTIGGPTSAAANLISGNHIGVTATGGTIQNNLIGTDPSGTLNVGNRAMGVFVDINGTNTQIVENRIAFNGFAPSKGGGLGYGAGVRIYGGQTPAVGNGNAISRNVIFANFGPGIDLGSDGVTPNDVPSSSTLPDQDLGPNLLQNFPVITSVTDLSPGTRIHGTLSSTPSSNFRLEFYANPERDEDTFDFLSIIRQGEFGEGKTFIGAVDVTTGVDGVFNFNLDLPALPPGQPFVTATATDITDDGSGQRNNTSEFSPVEPLGGCNFTVTNTGDTALGTLREAIICANVTAGAQTIDFAIPANDPRHVYYKDDDIPGEVTLGNTTVTNAPDDTTIADIDPDWPHSWFSIHPSHTLPTTTDVAILNGYTQPGSTPNTQAAPLGLNSILRIEIDGSSVSGNGLAFAGAPAMVAGLVLNRFAQYGISVQSDGSFLVGNYVGTDLSGTLALGNKEDGVFLDNAVGVLVGGLVPQTRNLISANEGYGIVLKSGGSHHIQGNLFGTSRGATATLANLRDSILAANSSTNVVGGFTPGATNVLVVDPGFSVPDGPPLFVPDDAVPTVKECVKLRDKLRELQPNYHSFGGYTSFFSDYGGNSKIYNAANNYRFCINVLKTRNLSDIANAINDNRFVRGEGVLALSAGLTSSLQQSAAGEVLLGIDLGNSGVTLNDGDNLATSQIDPDSDNVQNFPLPTAATGTAATTVITGTLNSHINSNFRIEFYSNTIGPSFRAGERFLGFMNVTTNAQGDALFTFTSPIVVPAGQFITTTATWLLDTDNDPATPLDPIGTSEFSDVIEVILSNAPWHNVARPLDVNNDQLISPIDVLLVINYLNTFGSGPLPSSRPLDTGFLDTNGDEVASPLDVLLIINFLNSKPLGEGEAPGRQVSLPTDLSYLFASPKKHDPLAIELEESIDLLALDAIYLTNKRLRGW